MELFGRKRKTQRKIEAIQREEKTANTPEKRTKVFVRKAKQIVKPVIKSEDTSEWQDWFDGLDND